MIGAFEAFNDQLPNIGALLHDVVEIPSAKRWFYNI
jgi:hypothetical protein